MPGLVRNVAVCDATAAPSVFPMLVSIIYNEFQLQRYQKGQPAKKLFGHRNNA
jgi:hypothetical protein